MARTTLYILFNNCPFHVELSLICLRYWNDKIYLRMANEIPRFQFVIFKWPMKILLIFSSSLYILQEVKLNFDGLRPKKHFVNLEIKL
jgi:hypothetical protein